MGPGRRRILIDALNVAYWCGSPPSLRIPIALMAALLADGQEAVLYLDASARYRLAHEADVYGMLTAYPQYVIEVASGRPADQAMLRSATSSGACVVSRDLYRDHRKRYRKLIDDPARLLSGEVAENRVLVPALGVCVRLPATAMQAWGELEPLLARFSAPSPGA